MANNTRKRSPQRGGFTLLEVMIVLFILVTLAAMAVVQVQGTRAQSQKQTAFTYVKQLADQVERYSLDLGRPPTTDQGLAALVEPPSDLPNPGAWAGPYIKKNASSRDPWGNDYQYASPGSRSNGEFDIWSYGPDGIDGNDDDIGSWMPSWN